jgi:hypothetical protein
MKLVTYIPTMPATEITSITVSREIYGNFSCVNDLINFFIVDVEYILEQVICSPSEQVNVYVAIGKNHCMDW